MKESPPHVFEKIKISNGVKLHRNIRMSEGRKRPRSRSKSPLNFDYNKGERRSPHKNKSRNNSKRIKRVGKKPKLFSKDWEEENRKQAELNKKRRKNKIGKSREILEKTKTSYFKKESDRNIYEENRIVVGSEEKNNFNRELFLKKEKNENFGNPSFGKILIEDVREFSKDKEDVSDIMKKMRELEAGNLVKKKVKEELA